MKQSFISPLLSGAMLWSSFANAQFTPPKDECDNPNFAVSPVCGAPWTKGDGKGYFCDTKWKSGLVICGIQTWAYKYHQKGFKVKYSDGTWGPLHGTTMQEYDKDNWTGDYSKNTVEWDCAAPLKDIRMISNWPGFGKYSGEGIPDAVGGIRLTTPDGKEYFVHGDIGSFPGTSFDMASGFLVGARGRSGGFVDTLEWRLMASPVLSAEIKSMKFKKDLAALNKSPDKVREMSLADLWFVNGDDKNDAPYKVTNDQEEKTLSAITHSTSHEFGVDVKLTVSAELSVPFLTGGKFETSVGTSYKMTKTDTSATTTEHNTKLSWVFEGKVKPKSAMFCKAWTFKGQYEDGYTATVLIKFKNGQSIEVEQDGQFMSVGWTSAVTRCDPKPFKDAPADAQDVSPTKSKFRMLKARAIGAH